jgi:hypothetical protein
LTPHLPNRRGAKSAADRRNALERTMPNLTIAAAIPAILVALAPVAHAEWPGSSQRQPDFSTCSSSRDACLIGTTRRGDDTARCDKAYAVCMHTGAWDTYGRYGRRIDGVARR